MGQAPPLQPSLTVAAVARRLGVAPPTLRTWDRRYGLGPSAHTAGAHRRYSPGDVARLLVMRRLTLEGVSPADAARIALSTPVDTGEDPGSSITSITPVTSIPDHRSMEGVQDPDGLDVPFDDAAEDVADTGPLDTGAGSTGAHVPDARDAAEDMPEPLGYPDVFDLGEPRGDGRSWSGGGAVGRAAVPPAPWAEGSPLLGGLEGFDQSSTGGGRVVAMPEGSRQARGLARAAMSLDTTETARLLQEAVSRDGVVPTWRSMIEPVLRALGERTAAVDEGIDVEHGFSEVVLGVLHGVTFGGRRAPRNVAPVLLACTEGDYHTMPLHALAAALAERGVGCRMLGPSLPARALAAAVRRSGPSAVVLFARMPGADAGHVADLRRQRPAPQILLGGPGWRPETVPPSARRLAGLAEAVYEVLLVAH